MSSFASIADACVALQAGKAAKPDFLAYAKSEKHDNEPLLKLFVANVLTMPEIQEILKAHQALEAANSKPIGTLSCSLGMRGGICIYGLNTMPVTLYCEQVERLLKWLNAPADNPLAKFIASKPTKEFSIAKLTTGTGKGKEKENNLAYVAEVMAGKHPHARIEGDKLIVGLAKKAAKAA